MDELLELDEAYNQLTDLFDCRPPERQMKAIKDILIELMAQAIEYPAWAFDEMTRLGYDRD